MRIRLLVSAAAATALVVAALASPASAKPSQPLTPTFVDGLAQPVFSTNPADWYSGEVWVQAPFDSDHDGVPDRIHADFTAPPEVLTQGLKVPVIFEDSPYYAGTADTYSNWGVDHELGSPPATRPRAPFWSAFDTSPVISTVYESTWVPRGFAVVHAESPGTGHSDGCPTSGGTNETLAGKAVIDWLNGRARAYTTRDGSTRAVASWTTGNVGMIGTSYNGTLPEAVATTGVAGLKAIVPISAISDWYDYYRANGMVRAPHSSSNPSGDNNAFQGEDLDVLADVVYSRLDETGARTICQPVIDDIEKHIDRATGNRNSFWQERNYMKDVGKVRAATLLAHGNNDFNVIAKNAAQFYDALKKQHVPHMFYFHQGGHGGAPPDVLINYWFTRYLYGVQNGVERLPRSWVVREAASCPPRQTGVKGDQSNTATLTVADTKPFRIGFSLTVPQTNADGTITTTNRLISKIPDSTHLVLASPVATTAGQKVADGATVSLLCSNANPTPYAEWPDPASSQAGLHLTPGAPTRGGLTFGPSNAGTETLTDDASIAGITSANAASSNVRLIYQTPPLTKAVRISGTPSASLQLAFSASKANVTAALVSYPPTGNGTILTRGWIDPANRVSDWIDAPVKPGKMYRMDVDLQPKDVVVPAGNRLALMLISSDRDFTIRPAPGTQLTLDLTHSSVDIPVVGGRKALADALN
ncbi:Xaa-Pro dipeptidyl-peptidase [Kribbella kalugense]|uniref:Xaa-Pro dipeptidyl-peptidase n=1 Tax=Kribbella kalugense TaxID=2512221 RepID=A0A4R7ZX02_9ACTN|nr:Xaa-Pro dipeptidyl-peptidase [Kribbella kalugense]TDW22502.1 putative CocE/NonD family hydrolase [Kribbella kalugense]